MQAWQGEQVIYFIQFRKNQRIKIGYTYDWETRRSMLRGAHGVFDVLGMMKGDKDKEAELHAMFEHTRIFNTQNGRRIKTEQFTATPELLEFIERNATKVDDQDDFVYVRGALSLERYEILRRIADAQGCSAKDMVEKIVEWYIDIVAAEYPTPAASEQEQEAV